MAMARAVAPEVAREEVGSVGMAARAAGWVVPVGREVLVATEVEMAAQAAENLAMAQLAAAAERTAARWEAG